MEAKIPKSIDRIQIDEFLNKNLRPNVNWSLRDEYPLAFSEQNMINMRFIQDDQKILAHAVLKTNLIQTQYHLFKVGFIGSVITDEEHRGKGLSKEVIKSCLDASQRQDCDFAMLWTDLFNFYSKFGFEMAGQEVALQVSKNFKAEIKESLRFLESSQVSPESILKLYNKHSLRTLRTTSDIMQYLKIPQTKTFTAWNKMTNELEAYCILGKGVDFGNYIHEWGGNVSAVVSLVKHIQMQQEERITLITPPQCSNLIRKMEDLGAEKFHGILGMIKIVNPTHLCKKIKKGARALGYSSFVFEYRDNQYFFGYGDEIYQTDSEQDIVRLIFGPMTPKQIHPFSPSALEALNEIFPIAFWVWGWDSI
jgi:N-acetylglutamate synthase-like GNAT family acetyltransferase